MATGETWSQEINKKTAPLGDGNPLSYFITGGVSVKVEIDLKENAIYIVRDGKITKIDKPTSGHGKQTAVWKDGAVIDVVKEERQRI